MVIVVLVIGSVIVQPRLVSAQFLTNFLINRFGLQGLIERKIHQIQLRLLTLFHRELFCYIDKWHGLSLEEVREYERKIKEELSVVRIFLITFPLILIHAYNANIFLIIFIFHIGQS